MLNLLPKYNFYDTDYIVSKWPIAHKAFYQYIEQCNIEASLISKIRQCLRLGAKNLIKCLPEISQDAEGVQCQIPENYMINKVTLKNFKNDILIINDFKKFRFDNKKFLQTMNQ